jgi:hypothetical protein
VILGQHATKKGTSTPNKPPDSPTWTLDEGEEIHRDINNLQNNTVTKDELQGMMDGLKREIMEGLKIFIIERTPGSENVSHEIHEENTRKMNQELRNSNFGLNTNHVLKIDMRKFFIAIFASPYAILHIRPFSISPCRLIFHAYKIQSQKQIFFHMYASFTLYNMCIRKLLHYSSRTSGFMPENEN